MDIFDIHPGTILEEEYLIPLDLTVYRLAKDIGVSQTRIGEIIKGKRSVTADTALRLAKYLSTTPQFWLNLQNAYDLRKTAREIEQPLASILEFNRPIVEKAK